MQKAQQREDSGSSSEHSRGDSGTSDRVGPASEQEKKTYSGVFSGGWFLTEAERASIWPPFVAKAEAGRKMAEQWRKEALAREKSVRCSTCKDRIFANVSYRCHFLYKEGPREGCQTAERLCFGCLSKHYRHVHGYDLARQN